MSILKTIILSQVFAANKVLEAKVLATNENGDVGSGNRLSDRSKRVKPKTERSKSQKSVKS